MLEERLDRAETNEHIEIRAKSLAPRRSGLGQTFECDHCAAPFFMRGFSTQMHCGDESEEEEGRLVLVHVK